MVLARRRNLVLLALVHSQMLLAVTAYDINGPYVRIRSRNSIRRPSQSCTAVPSLTVLQAAPYGRGTDIWPPPSQEPVRLTDSFPHGQVPETAVRQLKRINEHDPHRPVKEWTTLRNTMGRILRRASRNQQDTESNSLDVISGGSIKTANESMDKTPFVVALSLLLRGYLRPLDLLLVVFLSGYMIVLTYWAASLKPDGITPQLPALPPQGHVPMGVSNPLGYGFTYSVLYDRWLKLGILTGLLGPVILLVWYNLIDSVPSVAARWCARPLFLLCCQAWSETVSRRVMTPLPIRILVPVAYNVVRVCYLWNWTFLAPRGGALDAAGRALSVANLCYWSINLFGFLLPVASMRYLRAHFFSVEAEQVWVRPGMEDTIGLQR